MAGRGLAAIQPAWMTQGLGVGTATAAATSSQTPQPLLAAAPPPPLVGGLQSLPQANPMLRPLAPLQPWMEVKHPETGRVYFYNKVTQQSTFEKPEALKTAVERQLPTSQWREYVKEGKSYFVSSITGQSVWEEPMEFTTHKQRLTAMCAGEAPTRDMSSLALYNAAKKALEECVVDVDGSLAKRQELLAQMAESQFKRTSAAPVDLEIVSGSLVNPNRSAPPPLEGEPEELFEQMLRDLRVPRDVTWEEALSVWSIPTDPRYMALPTPAARKAAFAAYCQHPDPAKPSPDRVLADFNTMLDEFVEKKLLSARTSYAMAVVMMRNDPRYRALPVAESKDLIEARVEDLRTAQTRKREEEEQRQDALVSAVLGKFASEGKLDEKSKVSDGLQLLEGNTEVLAIPRLALRVAVKRFLRRHIKKEPVRASSRGHSRGPLDDSSREGRAKLRAELGELMNTGVIPVDLRWEDFRAGYLDKVKPDALLPLAGNVSAQERAFRDARDDARQRVRECGYALRDLNIVLVGLNSINDVAARVTDEDMVRFDTLQRTYGIGILNEAVTEQARRAVKERDVFIRLLLRENLDAPEVTWSTVLEATRGRTAFRDMSSNKARVEAWEELRKNPDMYKREHSREDRGRSKRRRF